MSNKYIIADIVILILFTVSLLYQVFLVIRIRRHPLMNVHSEIRLNEKREFESDEPYEPNHESEEHREASQSDTSVIQTQSEGGAQENISNSEKPDEIRQKDQ